MEIFVTLKKTWMNNPGKFHAKVSLIQNGIIQYGTCDSDASLDIKEENGTVKIGPWLQSSLASSCTSFNDILLKWKTPEVRKVELQIELYEDSTTNSTSDFNDIDPVLRGYGSLRLETQESFHLQKPKLLEGQSMSTRMFLKSVADVGGVKMNVGWISFSVCREHLVQDNLNTHEETELVTMEPEPTSKVEIVKEDGRFSPDEKRRRETVDAVLRRRSSLKLESPNLIEANEKAMFEFKVDDYLPESDAVKRILPMYYELLRSPPHSRSSVKSYKHIEEPKRQHSARTEKDAVHLESDVRVKESCEKSAEDIDSEQKKKFLDSHVISVLDYQTKELDRYRQAIWQMGDVIVELRKEISSLEITNSQLRAKLYYSDDVDEDDSFPASGTNASQSGLLKRRLLSKTEEIQYLKERIQKLQNEVIKKNESEKEFLKLRKAHEAQQSILQDLQAKATKYRLLEKTCQDQEKVIEKLEKLRANETGYNIANPPRQAKKVYFSDGFPMEKSSQHQLHEENQLVPIASHSKSSRMQNAERFNRKFMDFDIEDRFALLSKLEKADGRIMALENQIADTTRQWARERSQLKIQLADGLPSNGPVLRQLSPPPLPWNSRHNMEYESYYSLPQRNFRPMQINHRYHHL